jgi:phage protein U
MLQGKPRVQRTGERLDSISLSFMFHASFCNPSQEVQRLYDAMQAEEVLPFVLANGTVLGNFVIESVSDTIRKTDGIGNVIYLEAEAKLKEYPTADVLASQELEALASGFAADSETALPLTPIELQPSDFETAALDRSLIVNNASDVNTQIGIAQQVPAKEASALAKIKALSSAASIAALSLQNAVRQVESQIDDADRILTDAADTAKFASDMATAADSSLSDCITTNIAFQDATRRLKKSAAIFVTITASRG